MTTNEQIKIEQAIDVALNTVREEPSLSPVDILFDGLSDGGKPARRILPKLKVVPAEPLSTDEAARVAELLEAEGFPWEIVGSKVDHIGVTDNVIRRSKSVPRIKRGA